MKSFVRHPFQFVSRHKEAGVVSFVLGLVLALAYLTPYAGIFLPLLIAAFLYVLRRRGWGLGDVFVAGFVFAATYEFLILSWAWGAGSYLSNPSVGIPLFFALLLIFFTLALISVVAGITFLPWAYLVWRCKLSPVVDIFLIAGTWIASEWLRTVALSVLSYGEGVLNPPYLSFGMIGYTLADYPKISLLASFGGIYALSFFLVLLGGAVFHGYSIYKEKRDIGLVFITFVVVLVGICGFIGLHSSKTSSVGSVAVTVTTKYSFPEVPDYKENLKIAQDSSALIVLPEGSRQFYPFETVKPVSLHEGSVVIDSYPFTRKGEVGESAPSAFAVTAGTTTLIREKEALAPYGEFTPLAISVLARLVGFTKTLNQFTWQRHYQPGTYVGSFTYEGARASVIFCDEIGVPNIAKDIVSKTGATMIIAIASTHWFPNGYMLHRETVRMAKVRAIEAGVPIARSSYGDPAFVVDAQGTMLYEGPWNQSVIATVQVPVTAP